MGTRRPGRAVSEHVPARRPASPGEEPFVAVAPRVRHVWVRTSVRSEVVYAGLVIGWRRERAGPGAWFAQVAYVPVGYHDTGSLVVTWVPAEAVRPAGDG